MELELCSASSMHEPKPMHLSARRENQGWFLNVLIRRRSTRRSTSSELDPDNRRSSKELNFSLFRRKRSFIAIFI
jgi:hypothetical protein